MGAWTLLKHKAKAGVVAHQWMLNNTDPKLEALFTVYQQYN